MLSIEEYLENSIFFNENLLETSFSSESNEKIIEELQKYRQYVLTNFRIDGGMLQNSKAVTIMHQGNYDNPSIMELLKQCVLYVDTIYLDDPLFRFAGQYVNNQDKWEKILDFESEAINKKN